jgi:hypothetical protein
VALHIRAGLPYASANCHEDVVVDPLRRKCEGAGIVMTAEGPATGRVPE